MASTLSDIYRESFDACIRMEASLPVNEYFTSNLQRRKRMRRKRKRRRKTTEGNTSRRKKKIRQE